MAHNSGYTKLFVDRTDPNNPVGISLGEIRRCLYGVSGGTGVDLSRSPNINKWAKFKPMPVGDMSGYTDAAAKLINYGLHVPYYTTVLDMVKDVRQGTWTRAQNYDANKEPFQYVNVGANDWHRMLDFDKYQHLAPQPVGQIQARKTSIPPNDYPGLHASLGAYNSEYIVPSDFGFEVSGTDRRNLVIGFVACDGTGVATANLDDAHNIFDMLFSASTLNSQVSRAIGSTKKLPFTREADAPKSVPACIFLSWMPGSGSQLSVTMASTGLFIPLVFTRNQFSFIFEPFLANYSYDTIYPWEISSSDNHILTTVVSLLPNATCTGKFQIQCYKVNDELWADNGETDLLELSLPKFSSEISGAETQWPVFVKFHTEYDGIGAYYLVAESYLPAYGTTIMDVFNGIDVNGDPLVSESSDTANVIRGCSLYSGDTAENMRTIMIYSSLGTSALGYDGQTPYIIDPFINH